MTNFRRWVLAFFTFIGGFYFFLEFILPEDIAGFKFGAYHEQITKGIQVVGVMAIGLGLLNIFKVHGRAIIYLRGRWWNSAALLLGFLCTLGIEFMDFKTGLTVADTRGRFETLARFMETRCADKLESPECKTAERLTQAEVIRLVESGRGSGAKETPEKTAAREKLLVSFPALAPSSIDLASSTTILRNYAQFAQDDAQTTYENSKWRQAENFVRDGFFTPLGSAMFALLGFYIANAAYRSFRVRTLEASVLMLTALLVMLGQIPHGPLYISSHLPEIRLWLLKTVSTPAFRAIYFGSAIAGLSMAVRMWLSLERGPLAGDASGKAEGKK